MPAEKLKPLRPSPFLSPTMPKRLGPTRFGPFFSKVWQVVQTLAAAWPFSTEAVCRSFSIGSEGAAAAAPSLPAPAASLAAMAKPGFSGGLAAKIALAVKLVTNRRIQEASTAPMILLSSKESILAQAPGRKGSGNAAGGRRNRPGLAVSQRTPSTHEI